MILLLLMGLGAASVKAQVRIGGNTAPNASAVLDLNANDTNSGTKGLALPRVALTSNQMLLPGVAQNLTGMLVYNTSTTGGAGVNTTGIYFWNGATWVIASLPSTAPSDSGKVLMFNGTSWLPMWPDAWAYSSSSTTLNFYEPVSLTLILDTIINIAKTRGVQMNAVSIPGLIDKDFCDITGSAWPLKLASLGSTLRFLMLDPESSGVMPTKIRCYRPSV